MERHTISLARELMSRGHRVVLLELGHEVYSARGGILGNAVRTVTNVPLPRGEINRVMVRFWMRLIRHHSLDIIVLPKGTHYEHWPRLDLAIWLTGLPSVSIEHGNPPSRPIGRLLPGLGFRYLRSRAKFLLHRLAFDRVIAVSNAIKRRLADDYGCRPERVVVIHNGVDASVFRRDPEVRDSARARWGVPASAFVFGTLGRFSPEKRLDRALHAFREVVTSGPDCPLFLVMIGFGSEEASLRQLASELGLADRCIWPGESMAPWTDFPGFDCYLLTSETEGLPYSLIEAMACERVSVAVDVGGVGEVLVDDGVLTGDAVSDIAAAMKAVLSWSNEERAALGRHARRHVIEHHNCDRQVGAVASIIETLPAGERSA